MNINDRKTFRDLSDGQVVRLRNGKFYKFTRKHTGIERHSRYYIDYEQRVSLLIDDCGCIFSSMEEYNNDLTHKGEIEWDIVAVHSAPNWMKGFDPKSAEPLWDFEEVLEITIEELESKFGHKIKIID